MFSSSTASTSNPMTQTLEERLVKQQRPSSKVDLGGISLHDGVSVVQPTVVLPQGHPDAAQRCDAARREAHPARERVLLRDGEREGRAGRLAEEASVAVGEHQVGARGLDPFQGFATAGRRGDPKSMALQAFTSLCGDASGEC